MRSRHRLSGGTVFGNGRHSRFIYALSNSDVTALAVFVKDIGPLLPDPFSTEKAGTDIEIAHARYVDALFQAGPPEQTITSAITAMEALFLKKEPELMHRLAQRVSLFLRALGTQPDARKENWFTYTPSDLELLKSFVGLVERPDDAYLEFAQKYGPLGICQHWDVFWTQGSPTRITAAAPVYRTLPVVPVAFETTGALGIFSA